MNDDLDRVLSSEPEIEPSATFVKAVMAAVERESAAPPPIAFPWLRAAPLAAAAVGFLVFIGYTALSMQTASLPAPAPLASTPVLWTAVGLLVSAASVMAAAVRRER